MASQTLRMALFLAFAAFLVVQCSCDDSSEQVEFGEPSDEIKRQLSSPEKLAEGPSDRRKRSSVLAHESKPPGRRLAPSLIL
uniref:Uncharacterized protein n=1 Tax=Globodera rostochiensis TaxID=31243 RepID=A0A914HTJ9_GLORO